MRLRSDANVGKTCGKQVTKIFDNKFAERLSTAPQQPFDLVLTVFSSSIQNGSRKTEL